ncbi:hypothetical protein [Microbacterium sp.]|uniref:hypothetical protein n=1 Tax=Microbacterium sp. TaxID=51671 RepID=UPI00281133FF|nr:hypothetical protein [Microbacterium sp.]
MAETSEGSPRIREIDSPALMLVSALRDVVVGLTVGSVGTFLLLVVLGIIEEETSLFDGMGVSLDLDALFRASMGSVLISWGVMALAWPAVLVAGKFATFGAAEAFAARHPHDSPPRGVREGLRTAPGETVRGTGLVLLWIGAAITALFLLVTLVMQVQGENDDGIGWVLTGGCAVIAAAGYGLMVLGARISASQGQRVDAVLSTWRSRSAAAEKAERRMRRELPPAELPPALRRRRREGILATVGPWLLGAGGVMFMLAIVLRQPCRGCEQNEWGPTGEGLIDSLSTAGGGILTALGIASIGVWLFSVVRLFVTEEVLRRWLRARSGVRVADEKLGEFLSTPSAARLGATTLAAFGTSLLMVAGGVAIAEWEGLDPSIGLTVGQAMLFAAVLAGLVAWRRQVALRTLVRDRTLPGDPPLHDSNRRARQGGHRETGR